MVMNYYHFGNRFKKMQSHKEEPSEANDLFSAYETSKTLPYRDHHTEEPDAELDLAYDLNRHINTYHRLKKIIHKLSYVRHTFYKTEQIPTDMFFQLDIMMITMYSQLNPTLSPLHIIIKDYETLKEEFMKKGYLNERKWNALIRDMNEYMNGIGDKIRSFPASSGIEYVNIPPLVISKSEKPPEVYCNTGHTLC